METDLFVSMPEDLASKQTRIAMDLQDMRGKIDAEGIHEASHIQGPGSKNKARSVAG